MMTITRNTIINSLKNRFYDEDYVYAFWTEGADAIGRVDEFSDLDIWFDVEDRYVDQVIQQIKSTLVKLAPIDFVFEKKHGHPQIRQLFLHLEGTFEFLIIDLCVQSHSRKIEFIIENKDEEVNVIFDKKNVIKYKSLDIAEFEHGLKERIEELNKIFSFFSIWVTKEINRKNYLEALNYYHQYILKPLVELCRIRYEPTKYDFYLKHIKWDLPENVVLLLENLYSVCSIEEIEQKMIKAKDLFYKVMENKLG